MAGEPEVAGGFLDAAVSRQGSSAGHFALSRFFLLRELLPQSLLVLTFSGSGPAPPLYVTAGDSNSFEGVKHARAQMRMGMMTYR
jgi:hypothetical protein